ncbi:siderophore-interacting protein [Flammeovirga pectinis]|uniref:Siderophore-interacting protein n=1 Tax=Flammeovirga pectinis TaxID=2494373 RepID=A0A3Q9FRN8_9BACT|nr:SIP domain-containing protein [Flammeovirga pectinis]AZQ64502.1 siderophore-interacting protein [Flammeovirga pectinis]
MKIIEKILKSVLTETEIIYKKQLSKSAFHIRIQSEDFLKINIIPGAFLRVGIGIGKEELSMKDKIRSYSIWDFDQKKGVIDIAIATHSKGIGSYWVSNCKVGDKLFCKLKTGKFLIDEIADSYLMIGDLSALSHLYMIQRELGPNKYVKGIIYSDNKDDFFPDVDNKTPFDFYEKSQNPIDEVIGEIKKSLPLMHGEEIVYIAGDSRLCIALTKFFRNELKWKSNKIKTKPFWNPEKKGLE